MNYLMKVKNFLALTSHRYLHRYNVPLNRTIKIILKRIYQDKVFHTTLRKRTMKKVIIESCTKIAFSFNNKIYKEIGGVSMRSPFGLVLANIIITELEKIIVKDLVDNS